MSWTKYMHDNQKRLATLQKEIPDSFAAYAEMGKAAKTNGALSEKTKELIALGITISTKCEGCIVHHTKALVRLGTTREEFCEALSMISYMGGGPTMTYSAKALEAFDEFSQ